MPEKMVSRAVEPADVMVHAGCSRRSPPGQAGLSPLAAAREERTSFGYHRVGPAAANRGHCSSMNRGLA